MTATVRRLNHAVLYVRDARRCAAFYEEAFGFEVLAEYGEGAAVFIARPRPTITTTSDSSPSGRKPRSPNPAGWACTTSHGRSTRFVTSPRCASDSYA